MWIKQARLWRWAAFLLLGSILLMILLISSGWFDPKPVGSLRWQKILPPQTIVAGLPQITWLEEVETADYSVRATAVHQSGEKVIIYGLVLGSETDYLVAAVSPLGYVSLWQGDTVLLPLQPWPHVYNGAEPNEIWVDVEKGQLTVRINREILWEGEIAVAGGIGVMAKSWGETAVIQFPSVQLFTP